MDFASCILPIALIPQQNLRYFSSPSDSRVFSIEAYGVTTVLHGQKDQDGNLLRPTGLVVIGRRGEISMTSFKDDGSVGHISDMYGVLYTGEDNAN